MLIADLAYLTVSFTSHFFANLPPWGYLSLWIRRPRPGRGGTEEPLNHHESHHEKADIRTT